DERIKFIDFHTHNGSGSTDTVAVVNLFAGDDIPADFPGNTLYSAGIHPWHLTAENAEEQKTELILTIAHPHVVMIGEAGFDKIKGPDEKLQYRTFCFQAELAEELNKPLVIHCVKGWDLLLRARQEIKPSVRWIIHGFRGSVAQARILAAEGFLFSLGTAGISDGIISETGFDIILPETDATGEQIINVYRKFAEVTGKSMDELSAIFRKNFNGCFSGNVIE
ncbi:MAG TPA: TatD family hydrolase, partial [Bacteroidales bacterium]|nr:TatD family hydrolase [Bacteroidales bacterium]